MKKIIVIVALLIYGVTLLINLPAAVVVSWFPENSGLKVNNVTGTIWQGHAKQVVINPKVALNNVHWNVRLMALLGLTLKADIAFNNGLHLMSGKATVAYGLAGVSASNVLLDFTSQQLLTLLPMTLPVNIGGDFSVAIKDAQQGSPYCKQLQGTALWSNAYIMSQMGNLDLASPVIDLRCDNGNISALVTQQSSQLETTLDINLGKGGIYQLNGEIKGTDKLAPGIARALTWVGPKNDIGATTVSFKGKL